MTRVGYRAKRSKGITRIMSVVVERVMHSQVTDGEYIYTFPRLSLLVDLIPPYHSAHAKLADCTLGTSSTGAMMKWDWTYHDGMSASQRW